MNHMAYAFSFISKKQYQNIFKNSQPKVNMHQLDIESLSQAIGNVRMFKSINFGTSSMKMYVTQIRHANIRHRNWRKGHGTLETLYVGIHYATIEIQPNGASEYMNHRYTFYNDWNTTQPKLNLPIWIEHAEWISSRMRQDASNGQTQNKENLLHTC